MSALALSERGQRIKRLAAPTPVRLQLLSVLIVLGGALLGLAASVSSAGAHEAAGAIGRRTAPETLETDQTSAALAAADRDAANGFLATSSELSDPGPGYDTDIQTASRDLEQVAELNSAGGGTSDQLQSIDALVVVYMSLVGQAQAHRQEGTLRAAYLVYASRLLHGSDADPGAGLLARVDDLGAQGSTTLRDERSSPWLGAWGLGISGASGLSLLLLLVYTQAFVRRRFRRRRNNGLLAATALVLVLSGWTMADLVHTESALGVAQDQALPRLHTLWQARSLANDAGRDQDLALLTGANGDAFEREFGTDTGRLRVLLAAELRGAGFPGERQAAARALRAFQQFMEVDAAVRAQAASGDHDGAVAQVLGSGPGQLGDSWRQLDASLGQAIRIDQGRFDEAVASAGTGSGSNLLIPLGALGVVVAALWGLGPRLAEYRA